MRQRAILVIVCVLLSTQCVKKQETTSTTTQAPEPVAQTGAEAPKKLITLVTSDGLRATDIASATQVRVDPGNPTDADKYYTAIRANLKDFPKRTLQESTIADMLEYYGYGALNPANAERLPPAELMKPTLLPGLKAGDILCTRFFAPKIINVGAPQVGGVPKDGFGWRKVLRFRARDGSKARAAGLDVFFLLFNFTSKDPAFPEGKPAGQIQGILQPAYPTAGHRDLYFVVFEALNAANPQRVRGYLEATFDLVGIGENSKYYVPTACAQCHGSEETNEKGAKVNYLDTDHWIDRTGDDFKKVNPNDVIVDGAAAYPTFRTLNQEIRTQNEAVGGKGEFAWLAAGKWLELHDPAGADAARHVPPLRRGFVAAAGDRNWTAGDATDEALLPLLNQYCYRCHSSVHYHVFQKQVVFNKKGFMASLVGRGIMPQDRKLDESTKTKIKDLLGKLK